MKITFDFENGMVTTVEPKNLSIGNVNPTHVGVGYKTELGAVPCIFFPGQLATEEELKARLVPAAVLAQAPHPTVLANRGSAAASAAVDAK